MLLAAPPIGEAPGAAGVIGVLHGRVESMKLSAGEERP
jgi:hypothetical protein